MSKQGGIFEQIAKEIPLYYTVSHIREGFEEALKWLQTKTESEAQRELEKTYILSVSEERQYRRQVYLKSMYLQHKKALEEGNEELAVDLYERIIKVRYALAEEGTRGGKASAALAGFNAIDPMSVVWMVNKDIQKVNKKKTPETDIQGLQESEKDINKLSKDAAKEALNDKSVNDTIEAVTKRYSNKANKQTDKMRAKEFAAKVRKMKPSNWNITLAADPISSIGIGVLDGALELTARTIEISGNISAAIKKGIAHIKASDWYKGLKSAQQRKIERVYAMNVRTDLGVEKVSEKELETYLRVEAKDLSSSIKKIIKSH